MKITQKQIAEGWTKNEDGIWVAPSEATKKALDARKHQVLLDEARRLLLDETHTVLTELEGRSGGSAQPTTKEIENAQLHAYQRVGLSRAEAIRAVELANGKARFNKG